MSSSTVEQIKARLSIVDVIGSYLKLEKAGINFKACCPFHNEKTPSFFVSPNRDSYHCFGCSKGGDIFSFVQDIEGVDFVGALKTLAERAGVELLNDRPENKSIKDRLHELLDKATAFYQDLLTKAPLVRDYIHQRGLTDETINRFGIGYVPDAWRMIVAYLRDAGFSESEIEQSGLAIKGELKPGQREAPFYDRFRNRIMFPVKDAGGRVIGFSGRVYGSADDNVAKYINTPQTVVYDKSKVLYGFDLAKVAIRRENTCVLVEGQMDLVLSHQAGVVNTVAVSGTALTEEHLRSIRRLADTLVMAFDGDGAGIRAAKRGVEMALLLEFEVKIAELPDGSDPADMVRNNPEEWRAAVLEAKHVIDFYLGVLSRKEKDKRVLGGLVRAEVLPYIARLASRLDQAHFIQKISELLGIADAPIWDEVNNLRSGVVLKNPELNSRPEKVKESKSRLERVSEVLFGLIWWQEAGEHKDLVSEVVTKIKVVAGDDFTSMLAQYEAQRDQLIMRSEIGIGEVKDFRFLLGDAYGQFRVEFLKEQLRQTLILVKEAEIAGDGGSLDLYLKKCQDISSQLRNSN